LLETFFYAKGRKLYNPTALNFGRSKSLRGLCIGLVLAKTLHGAKDNTESGLLPLLFRFRRNDTFGGRS